MRNNNVLEREKNVEIITLERAKYTQANEWNGIHFFCVLNGRTGRFIVRVNISGYCIVFDYETMVFV